MSDIKTCRYGCNIELGKFDEKENKYRELSSGLLHTRERCQSIKSQATKKVEANNKPLSLEELDVRLKRVEAMFNGGLQK